jgi:alkylation response protein AidB-like acyl-CoA dehydrogenase
MEAIADLTTAMSDSHSFDIRLEAAACKEWNTFRGWQIVDEAMQIRGGRGYETERSLEARGEQPIGIERMMRDYRINKIFEGSTEIMHLFMAREAVDKHLEVAGSIIDPKKSGQEKMVDFFQKMLPFYAAWYPTRWVGWGRYPRFAEFGALAGHLGFCERSTRKLAREIFHGMVVHGPKLQNKQAFLFRVVDVANELFAMAASVTRAHALAEARRPEAPKAAELADLFCRMGRRRVRQLLRDLWSNDDSRKYRVAQRVLEGKHSWLETNIMPQPPARAMKPPAAAGVEPEPAPQERPVGTH